MKDKEFLQWICDRLENVYGENPQVDFMLKLKAIIKASDPEQDTPRWSSSRSEKVVECPKGFEVKEFPSWKNTIHNFCGAHHNIVTLAKHAHQLGYLFIAWNDRIYFLTVEVPFGQGDIVVDYDTGWTIRDMKNG